MKLKNTEPTRKLVLDVETGDSIPDVAEESVRLVAIHDCAVEFTFNQRTIRVNPEDRATEVVARYFETHSGQVTQRLQKAKE